MPYLLDPMDYFHPQTDGATSIFTSKEEWKKANELYFIILKYEGKIAELEMEINGLKILLKEARP